MQVHLGAMPEMANFHAHHQIAVGNFYELTPLKTPGETQQQNFCINNNNSQNNQNLQNVEELTNSSISSKSSEPDLNIGKKKSNLVKKILSRGRRHLVEESRDFHTLNVMKEGGGCGRKAKFCGESSESRKLCRTRVEAAWVAFLSVLCSTR